MTDSGLRRDLSLIPTIKPTEKKLLYKHGIRDFVSLAQLKTLPSGSASRLQPVSGQESLASTLEKETGLGPRLDTLIQRARRLSSKYAQKTGAPPVRSRTFIYNSGFTRLPNPSVHGGMVQVFLDSQHDYLEDRIYLLAALVKGPKGERAVVKMSKHPPQEHDERQLLGDWLKQLFQSICDVAQSSNSYLHFYVYDRYDQRVLLDALRRHLEGISTMVPAVYDLLTQSEALDQDMVSFLADEIRLRQNVATTCLSLYLVAQNMGYKWDETLRTKFIHRVFDSYARETNKGIVLKQQVDTTPKFLLSTHTVPGSIQGRKKTNQYGRAGLLDSLAWRVKTQKPKSKSWKSPSPAS
jgi:predicted RecB family nuclease